MMIQIAALSSYKSSKRKREPSESELDSSSASPTSTVSIASFQEARLRGGAELRRYSPRAYVAGRLNELTIQDRNMNCEGDGRTDHPKRWSSIDISLDESESTQAPTDLTFNHTAPSGPTSNLPDTQVNTTESKERTTEAQSVESNHETSQEEQIEIETPPSTNLTEPSTPSPVSKKITPKSSPKRRNLNRSPPPGEGSENPFTWQDSEITGYDPADPSDDGYGINGIGFKPTAAVAWARSQKRQKQLAEWKAREAREARERRRERRDGIAQRLSSDNSDHGQKRVKFDFDAEET
jgi:hypothetical protein